MPFDLCGRPQETQSALNSSRLAKAMSEIEDALDLEPVYENTKFAIVDKYELRNYFDDDGCPEKFLEE